MARDYKQRSRSRKQPTPGWVWLLTGLTCGLAVALFVHLQHTRGAPAELAVTRTVKPASQKAEETAELEPAPEAGFDFYTMLPGLEVVVPEDDPRPRATGATGVAAQPQQLAPGRYWIQAGSFRRYQDADRRKAELALLGISSGIQPVTLDGQTWHRVRIGPLPDAAQAEATRRRLAESGIGALAVRERD